MPEQHDFKNELEKAKKQLMKFSKDAVELAKKGEKELVQFSKTSKLHIEITTAGLKKEHLFYLIGKEYVKAKTPAAPTPRLNKLLVELKELEKKQKLLKGRINKKTRTK